MPNLLEEANATLSELLKMHKLNQELLETLQVTMIWIRDFAQSNNIAFPNDSTYDSLINKAQILIDELTGEPSFRTDEFLHEGRNRRRLDGILLLKLTFSRTP